MLSDLNKEFAVIIFFNTSLSEKDEGVFFDIYESLYKYAQDLKAKQTMGKKKKKEGKKIERVKTKATQGF